MANAIRLLKLPDIVITELRAGSISAATPRPSSL